MISCYKIFHGLPAVRPEVIFVLSPAVGSVGHRFKISAEYSQTEAWRRLFLQQVIHSWNSLFSHVVEASSTESFKNLLHLTFRDDLFWHYLILILFLLPATISTSPTTLLRCKYFRANAHILLITLQIQRTSHNIYYLGTAGITDWCIWHHILGHLWVTSKCLLGNGPTR